MRDLRLIREATGLALDWAAERSSRAGYAGATAGLDVAVAEIRPRSGLARSIPSAEATIVFLGWLADPRRQTS